VAEGQVIGAEGHPVTRADLKAHYAGEKEEHEKRTEFFTWLLYRRVSFVLTPPFLRAGMSPNQVSMVGLLVSLLMPLAAFLDPAHAHFWIAGLAVTTLLLDCVDGNMARHLGVSSRLGQYVDSIAGKVYIVSLLLGLGMVAQRDAPGIGMSSWLLVSMAGAFIFIWGRESRAYFKLYLSDTAESMVAGELGWQHLVLGLTDLLPLALVVFGAVGMGWVVLLGLVAFHAATFLATQARIFSRI
jgi:phosphatidylglycerophosphate synthase